MPAGLHTGDARMRLRSDRPEIGVHLRTESVGPLIFKGGLPSCRVAPALTHAIGRSARPSVPLIVAGLHQAFPGESCAPCTHAGSGSYICPGPDALDFALGFSSIRSILRSGINQKRATVR